MTIVMIILSVMMIFVPGRARGFLDDLLNELSSFGHQVPGELSEDKIMAGLKEALEVGTGNAVKSTGVTDGFLRNEAIRIGMPLELQKFDQALRLIGYGPQLDQFVVSMNRGAEQATARAKPIFIDAITSMTFDDAKGILQGSEVAATEYFEKKTTDKLSAVFRPQVESALNQVGVTKQYHELVGKYKSIPFVSDVAFDIDQYVVDQTLKGLFHVVAEEERKIRTDPGARVTDLLKDVFGSRK